MQRRSGSLGRLAPAAWIPFVLVTWSCGENSPAPGMGSLSVFMAFGNGFPQAPEPGIAGLAHDDGGWGRRTPLSDLIVTIDSVEAWTCAADPTLPHDDDDDGDARLGPLHDDDDDDDDDDDEHGWDKHCEGIAVLTGGAATLSASGLDTTLTALVGTSDLPAGDYDFLVLGIVEAVVVTQAGDFVVAKVPSGRIKVKSPFSIGEGGATDIVIVFDVNRSVVEAPPGSLRFLVKPVLRSHVRWADPDDHHDDDDDDDDGDDDDDDDEEGGPGTGDSNG